MMIAGKTARGRTYLRQPLIDRLLSRVVIGDCWVWSGPPAVSGYGQISTNDGAGPMLVHRVVYETLVGPVDGLELDHLCRNKLCVNPDHLELLTKSEHSKRNHNALKMHCKHGHPLFGANVRNHTRNGHRHRDCRACGRERAARARCQK